MSDLTEWLKKKEPDKKSTLKSLPRNRVVRTETPDTNLSLNEWLLSDSNGKYSSKTDASSTFKEQPVASSLAKLLGVETSVINQMNAGITKKLTTVPASKTSTTKTSGTTKTSDKKTTTTVPKPTTTPKTDTKQ